MYQSVYQTENDESERNDHSRSLSNLPDVEFEDLMSGFS